jgi:probable F420-dependent oxidoreductase
VDVWAPTEPRLPLGEVPEHARRAERAGYTGLLVPEAVHDPFLVAGLALEHTRRLRAATSVALAFPRSPTIAAHAAWDLARFSGGRFELGLGSQTRANLEGRFGVEWRPPVPRMREYVGALRAIWRAWHEARPLAFEGEHYRLSRMQPFFRPEPLDDPEIRIHLAAVNPRMVRLAGEVADALVTHPTCTSPRYLRELARPALEAGAKAAGRDPAAIRCLASGFVATGPDDDAVRDERERIRGHLGFLYSTPEYERGLELLGHAGLGGRLRGLAREGRWTELPALVGDDLLDALVPAAPYPEIAERLLGDYAGLATALVFPLPADPAHDREAAQVVERLRGG